MRSGGEDHPRVRGVPRGYHWTAFPHVMLDEWMPVFSDAAWRVACHLARETYGRRGREAFTVSIRALAHKLRRSTATIQKAVRELEEAGAVVIERRRHADGSPAPSRYRLRWEDE